MNRRDPAALVPMRGGAPTTAPAEAWPEPGVIAAAPEPEPYPVEALPPVARTAVLEYQNVGKQPLAMVASACLAQIAIITQGLADVGRDNVLVGPISLNVLIIGESGER